MFGGHLARVLADAAVEATGQDLVPVSTSVAFLRPAMPGPASVTATVLKTGRRYSAVSCTLETGVGPVATALVTLAPAQSTAFAISDEPTGLPAEPMGQPGDGEVAGRVDWRTVTPWARGARPGPFESWFRLREAVAEPVDLGRYLVASDLIGPAIAATGRALPFRIATVSLDMSAIAASNSDWLHQVVEVQVLGAEAVARLELRDPNGTVLAIASHRVVILDASDDELPAAVTAFGWGS